jgi:small GTP-binding protein
MSDLSPDHDPDQTVSQTVKLVILGDGAVGKTTLIKAIYNYTTSFGKNSRASDQTERTKFIDFKVIPSTSQSPVIYSFWDLQGQRQASCHPIDLISDTILRSAGLVIFVFAMNDAQSFENLFIADSWYEISKRNIEQEQIPIIFVGNKADAKPEVIPEAVEKISKRYPTFKKFIMTSAITGEGIEELVKELRIYVSSLYNYQIIDSQRIFSEVINSQTK